MAFLFNFVLCKASTVGSLGGGEEAAYGLGRKGPENESSLFSHIFKHNMLCFVVAPHSGAERIYP